MKTALAALSAASSTDLRSSTSFSRASSNTSLTSTDGNTINKTDAATLPAPEAKDAVSDESTRTALDGDQSLHENDNSTNSDFFDPDDPCT